MSLPTGLHRHGAARGALPAPPPVPGHRDGTSARRPPGPPRTAAVPGAAPHGRRARPRFDADRREREKLAARFFDALSEGDVEGLRELLAADVQMVGDGGGEAPQLAPSITGADNAARVLASIFPRLVRIDVTVEPHEVNGQPGAIFRDRDNKVLFTLALDVLDGRIQAIRSVSNPDKLRQAGPVADAWAAAREVNQARRRRRGHRHHLLRLPVALDEDRVAVGPLTCWPS